MGYNDDFDGIAMLTTDELMQQKIMSNSSGLESLAYKGAYISGNIMPGIMMNGITCGGYSVASTFGIAMNAGLYGVSAGGDKKVQMERAGYTEEQAVLYGVASGLADAAKSGAMTAGSKLAGGQGGPSLRGGIGVATAAFAVEYGDEAVVNPLLQQIILSDAEAFRKVDYGQAATNSAYAAAITGGMYALYALNNRNRAVEDSYATKKMSPRNQSFDELDLNEATSKQKGNYGEYEADYNLENNQSLKDAGYDLKRIGNESPQSPDDKLRKGIDGIYKNENPDSNIKYVIDEAKFGKSSLSYTRDGRQMSDDWLTGEVSGTNRIKNALQSDKELLDDINNALAFGQVERVLSRVDANGNVMTYRLNSDGEIVGTWP